MIIFIHIKWPVKNFQIEKTYETYNNGRFTNIEDWRRNNVNELVKDLNTAIKQEKHM